MHRGNELETQVETVEMRMNYGLVFVLFFFLIVLHISFNKR